MEGEVGDSARSMLAILRRSFPQVQEPVAPAYTSRTFRVSVSVCVAHELRFVTSVVRSRHERTCGVEPRGRGERAKLRPVRRGLP
jgi:hypothetical protein